jgi:hypothetical protein
LKFEGSVPERIRMKANSIVSSLPIRIGNGWKKVVGLDGWFSYRLNNNYRVLCSGGGNSVVSNHDIYLKTIRKLKSN